MELKPDLEPASDLSRPGGDRRRQARRDSREPVLRGQRRSPAAIARHQVRPPDRGADHGAWRDLDRPPAPCEGPLTQRRRIRRRGPRGNGSPGRSPGRGGPRHGARGSASSSRAISSTPCASANSMTPPPGSHRRRGSSIGLPPRASMSRASIASGLRSRPAASMIDDAMGFQLVPWRPALETAAWPTGQRRDGAWQQRRLESRPEAGARYLKIPQRGVGWIGDGPLCAAKPEAGRASGDSIWPENEPAALEGALTQGEVESGLLRVR